MISDLLGYESTIRYRPPTLSPIISFFSSQETRAIPEKNARAIHGTWG